MDEKTNEALKILKNRAAISADGPVINCPTSKSAKAKKTTQKGSAKRTASRRAVLSAASRDRGLAPPSPATCFCTVVIKPIVKAFGINTSTPTTVSAAKADAPIGATIRLSTA